MPELPEVETVKRGLNKLIIGKRIVGVSNNWAKSFPASKSDTEAFLIDASVTKLSRRAKVLVITLDSGYSLVIHLKMTGQLVFIGKKRFGAGHPDDGLVDELPNKSTRVVISFEDGSKLFFNDQRKFGWMRLLPSAEIDNIDFFKRLGPEPLSSSLSDKDFIERLQRRPNTAVKAALLDQSVIAGIGNIYADESLWAAKIHPETKVGLLSKAKLKLLLSEIRRILRLSIKHGGSTDRNYVDAEGKKGSYLKFAKVFRRTEQACPRCGRPISKIRVAGRGTHLCTYCQRRRNG